MSRRVLGVLVAAALTFTASAAAAAPCPATDLTTAVGGVAWTRLDTLLLAGDSWSEPPQGSGLTPAAWATLRDEAVTYVRGCDFPTDYPESESLAFMRVFQDSATRVLDAVRDYQRENNVTIPILGSALGLPTGPAPQPLQLGLSQVVAAGEPGFLGGLSVTPGIRSEGHFQRHATVVANALIMNAPGAMGVAGDPKFASGELHFAYSSARTVWDFAAEVIERGATTDAEFDRRAWNAARLIVSELKAASAAGVADMVAVHQAVETARRLYAASTRAYLTDTFIRPEAERNHVNQWSLSVVLRGSPHPEFLPEIPDKYSAQLNVSGTYRAVGKDKSLSLDGNASAAFSKDPVTGVDKDTLLVDASGGLALILPSAAGPTRLTARGLFRYALRDTMTGEKEVSGGVAISLLVPIGGDIGISATYAWRYLNGVGDAATSSISIAKTIE
jgi:hypothetical protein